MKRILFAVMLLLLLGVVIIYLIIPAKVFFSVDSIIIAPVSAVKRNLTNDSKWKIWWPGNELTADSNTGQRNFEYQGLAFQLRNKFITSLEFEVTADNWTAASMMNFEAHFPDTTIIHWTFELPSAQNPLLRVQNYFRGKSLSADVATILAKMQAHYAIEENLYGGDINMASLKDSALISTFQIQSHRPATEEIYKLIDKLHIYISANRATETGHPMLNITPVKDSFIVRVAIPVNKWLPGSGSISFKRMPAGVKILTSEILGGMYETEKRMREIENFAADYSYASPAIPFYTLVTDRIAEPDSSKWVTRITYPVMSGIPIK